MALLGTLPGWTVHVPGHPDEAERLLRSAAAADGLVYLRLSLESNAAPLATGRRVHGAAVGSPRRPSSPSARWPTR